MPVVSITRLRVRSWRFLPSFFVAAMRSAFQAARADGVLKVTLLRDGKTYWTNTSWASDAAMKAFMHAKPHGPAMRRLLEWCDEASLVHWTQDSPELPTWEDAHRRLAAEGRPSKVHHPTPAHIALEFPPPVARKTGQLHFKS